MKRILGVLLLVFTLNVSQAAFTVSQPEAATTETVAKTEAQKNRELMEMVVKMSVKDYEVLRGKKMNIFEKIAFKATKKRFEKQLAADDTEGFNIGGFLLGFFLGLIGVLLSYIFSSDSNFHKWTWIGLGAAVVFVLLFVLL